MRYIVSFIIVCIGYAILSLAAGNGITDPGLFWFIGVVTGTIGFGVYSRIEEKY